MLSVTKRGITLAINLSVVTELTVFKVTTQLCIIVQAKQVSVGNGTAQLCWRSVIGTNGVLITSNSNTVSNRPTTVLKNWARTDKCS